MLEFPTDRFLTVAEAVLLLIAFAAAAALVVLIVGFVRKK